jgi:hypothetical protein
MKEVLESQVQVQGCGRLPSRPVAKRWFVALPVARSAGRPMQNNRSPGRPVARSLLLVDKKKRKTLGKRGLCRVFNMMSNSKKKRGKTSPTTIEFSSLESTCEPFLVSRKLEVLNDPRSFTPFS